MDRSKPAGIGLTLGVFLGALALGGLLAARAVSDSRSAANRDPLELAATLERSRVISLESLGERAEALAVHRWSGMGLSVTSAGEAGEAGESGGARVVLHRRGADGELPEPVVRLLGAAGLDLAPKVWAHSSGVSVPAARAAVAVTVGEPQRLATHVVLGRDEVGLGDDVIERLTRVLPPTRTQLVLWNDGHRRLDVPLTLRGRPVDARARVYPGPPPKLSRGSSPDGPLRDREFGARLEELRQRLASIGLSPPDGVRVVGRGDVGDRGLDGPVERAGWYDPRRREISYLRGVQGAEDDALEGFAATELLAALGAPRERWLLDGAVHGLVGSAGGLAFVEIDDRGEPVTFEEALGAAPRTRSALAPARARLARHLLELCDSDWQRAFETSLDAALREQLEAAWNLSALVERSADRAAAVATPDVREPGLAPGVAVRISGSPDAAIRRLGTPAFRAELARQAALGFSSVVLEVHVPVAPPNATERAGLPLALEGWGRSVTLEGDGAVLAAAADARALGLGVTLWPRVVASPSGVLAGLQIHDGPEQYAIYGRRLALTLEGVAWLAERAGANALIVLGPEQMPFARELVSDVASAERRAGYPRLLTVRADVRRQVEAFTRPFRGARLGSTLGLLGWRHAVTEADQDGESVFRAGGLGVLVDVEIPGPATALSLRAAFDAFRGGEAGFEPAALCVRLGSRSALGALGQCLRDGDWPTTLVLARWDIGFNASKGTDLRSLSGSELRGATGKTR